MTDRVMPVWALLLAFAASPVLAAQDEDAGRESVPDEPAEAAPPRPLAGGRCGEQVAAYIAQRFGQTVHTIDYRWRERKSLGSIWNTSSAVAYVHECPGFYYFTINATRYDCEDQYHYGTIPNYALYRSANAGC